MPIAVATITKFLIIYWPSRVGTRGPVQVSPVSKKSGPAVVIMCKKSIGMTPLSAPGIKNKIPIKHSKSPKIKKKVLNSIIGMVSLKRFWTTWLAGDMSSTLSMPNQKKTTNRANLETGMAIFLKKRIIFRSRVLSDMLKLYTKN